MRKPRPREVTSLAQELVSGRTGLHTQAISLGERVPNPLHSRPVHWINRQPERGAGQPCSYGEIKVYLPVFGKENLCCVSGWEGLRGQKGAPKVACRTVNRILLRTQVALCFGFHCPDLEYLFPLGRLRWYDKVRGAWDSGGTPPIGDEMEPFY